MFSRISEKMADNFVKSQVVEADDRELYQYGVRQGLNIVLNIATTLVIGLLFSMVWQAALFMTSYILIRSFAGGYHASTHEKCYILSTLMVIAVVLAMKYITLPKYSCIILLVLAGIVIMHFSPVADANKPLDETEKRVYRKRALIIFTIESFVALVLLVSNFLDIASCIILSIIASSVMILVAVIINSYHLRRNIQTDSKKMQTTEQET